jgi:hypothetical protein
MMQLAHAGQPISDSREMSSVPVAESIVVVSAVVLAPVLLYIAGLAPHARLIYPAGNFLLASYLFLRRSPWYLGHVILLFCFTPLIRRLVDEQAGWDASNPVLLAPYLASLVSIVSLIRYWKRAKPEKLGPFLAVLLAIAYGVVLAMIHGRTSAALVDGLKWSVGPLLAIFILENRDRLSSLRPVFEISVICAGVMLAVYGVIQYIRPPSWDAAWVENAATLGLDSIGQAEPFKLRVFSTMNAPGSFGAVMLAGILLALKRRVAVSLPVVGIMVIGLALCQYRAIWTATLVGLALIVLSPGTSLRPLRVTAFALFAALGVAMALPEVRTAVTDRAMTVTDLRADASLEDRLNQYGAMLVGADDAILGSGLAISGASRRLDGQAAAVIDSGLIEIWRAMGIIVGTLFLASLAAVGAALFSQQASPDRHLIYDRAIFMTMLIQLPMGSVHVGESGVFAWLCAGFGIAAALALGKAAVAKPQELSAGP